MQPKRKVLFVDDEPHVLAAIARKLRREFDVVTACGSESGFSALNSEGPFLAVVADMQMPGMDGITFLLRVKESHPDTIRIMLTGNADHLTLRRAFEEAGIYEFLNKPCSPELLLATIRDAMAA